MALSKKSRREIMGSPPDPLKLLIKFNLQIMDLEVLSTFDKSQVYKANLIVPIHTWSYREFKDCI